MHVCRICTYRVIQEGGILTTNPKQGDSTWLCLLLAIESLDLVLGTLTMKKGLYFPPFKAIIFIDWMHLGYPKLLS